MKEIVEFELDDVRKALLILAEHVERCPYNDYKVSEEVENALGIERVLEKSNARAEGNQININTSNTPTPYSRLLHVCILRNPLGCLYRLCSPQ